jgi:hypothetical protein
MTTFTYKTLGFYVKSDTQAKTQPVLGVDTAGNLVLPVPTGATAAKGIAYKGTDGNTYYLQVLTTAPP